MTTIKEKLLSLNTAKQDIKEAIKSKGADLTDITFEQYGDAIRGLDTKENLDDVLAEQDVAVTELEDVTDGMPTESPTCTDVTDTTATAGDVMTGKVFYDAEGVRTEGTGTLAEEIKNYIEISLSHLTGTTYYTFISSKNDIFFSTNKSDGLFRFNPDTKQLDIVLSGAYSMSHWYEDKNGNLYVSSDSYFYGLYIYNPNTKLFDKLYSGSYMYKRIVELPNGEIIMSANAGPVIKIVDKTATNIYSVGGSYQHMDFYYNEAKNLLFGIDSNNKYVYYYDEINSKFVQTSAKGVANTYDKFFFTELGTIFTTNIAGGAYYFNEDIMDFINIGIYSTISYGAWAPNCTVYNDQILVNGSGQPGIIRVNTTSKTYDSIDTTQTYWYLFVTSNNKLIGGCSGTGIYYYDETIDNMVLIENSDAVKYIGSYYEHNNILYASTSNVSSGTDLCTIDIRTLEYHRIDGSKLIEKGERGFVNSEGTLYLVMDRHNQRLGKVLTDNSYSRADIGFSINQYYTVGDYMICYTESEVTYLIDTINFKVIYIGGMRYDTVDAVTFIPSILGNKKIIYDKESQTISYGELIPNMVDSILVNSSNTVNILNKGNSAVLLKGRYNSVKKPCASSTIDKYMLVSFKEVTNGE